MWNTRGQTVKVGDIVKYGHSKYGNGGIVIGLVMYVNTEGGTVRVVDQFGNDDWFVTGECSILSEGKDGE